MKNTTDTSVKVVAGQNSWTELVINEMYNYGLTATYGGSNNSSNILQSHMIKNSEWGAVTYLAHSQFGLNGGRVARNSSNKTTGGGANVYSSNIYQSTTHNIYGVYDLNGTNRIYVASYENNNNTNLSNYGNYDSSLVYKFYGNNNDEKSTSTKFKMVYLSRANAGVDIEREDYSLNSWVRGDCVFETSIYYKDRNSWYKGESGLPYSWWAIFTRGMVYYGTSSSLFSFQRANGSQTDQYSFLVAL